MYKYRQKIWAACLSRQKQFGSEDREWLPLSKGGRKGDHNEALIDPTHTHTHSQAGRRALFCCLRNLKDEPYIYIVGSYSSRLYVKHASLNLETYTDFFCPSLFLFIQSTPSKIVKNLIRRKCWSYYADWCQCAILMKHRTPVHADIIRLVSNNIH